MVDFAQGNTVRDDGISVWLRVANDVSGVQQFDVTHFLIVVLGATSCSIWSFIKEGCKY